MYSRIFTIICLTSIIAAEVFLNTPSISTWYSIPNGAAKLNKWTDSGRGSYDACSRFNGDADAYLMIPFIGTSSAKQISIEIKFSIRDCSSFHPNCKLWFGLYALASSRFTVNPSPLKTKFEYVGYAQNTTVLDGSKSGEYSTKFAFELKGRAGLYIAVRDQGFCGKISALKVSYFTCLTKLYGRLTEFPYHVAPNSSTRVVTIRGRCLENAVNTKPDTEITLDCYASGHVHSNSECICSAGYEKAVRVCVSCQTGYFKPMPAKIGCLRCGLNTKFEQPPIKCQCLNGFYRFKGKEDKYNEDCFSLPSPPRNIQVAQQSKTTAVISWQRPGDTGRLPVLWYSVACRSDFATCKGVKTEPTSNAFVHLNVSFRNLKPFTEYIFAVCAGNNISESAGKDKWNFGLITFRTDPTLPANVESLKLAQNRSHLIIQWKPPRFIGDVSVSYLVNCNESIVEMTTQTTVSFKIGVSSNLLCKVRAKNTVGYGKWIEKYHYFIFTPEVPSTASTTLYSTFPKTTAVPSQPPSSPTTVSIGKNPGNSGSQSKILKVSFGITAAVIATICLVAAYFARRRIASKNGGNSAKVSWSRKRARSRSQTYDHIQRDKVQDCSVINKGIETDCIEIGDEDEDPIYMDISNDQLEFSYNDLSLIKEIGEGEFGLVYLADAFNISGYKGHSKVAVKMLKDTASEESRQDFITELSIMRRLKSHACLVRLLGCSTKENHKLIILEYLQHGNLLRFLRKSRGYDGSSNCILHTTSLSSNQLLEFSLMVADGMSHLESQNIIHRDLACRNILVGSSGGKFICKISDLGLAREPGESNGIYQRGKQALLPVKWMAYESLFHGTSTIQSDVWSFGIVLYEIFTIGNVPYPEYKSTEIPKLIQNGYRMGKIPHCSKELYGMMFKCWKEEAKERPTFSEMKTVLQNLLESNSSLYLNLDQFNNELYTRFDVGDDSKGKLCDEQNTF